MIQFYFHPSPNPAKVALMLEEMGLQYEVVPADTRKGERHAPSFTAINPNAKTPAVIDGEIQLFDSNAILLYYADRTRRFVAAPESAQSAEALSWLMFIATGIGPYSGQSVHFTRYAPPGNEYSIKRYIFEAWRHWNILDKRLSTHEFMVGTAYSIVDMAFWGWARAIPAVLGERSIDRLPHVKRLFLEISAREAAKRAEALGERFDFKKGMDAQATRAMFRHLRQEGHAASGSV